jgi:DNA polymerase-4
MEVLRRFTPLVEPLSLDEAFLDVGGGERIHGRPDHVAGAIRRTILEEEELTCSVGVAPNKFLAKLASEAAKPRVGRQGPIFGSGVSVVNAAGIEEFLNPLAVEAVWGVGPRTLERLRRLGVRTVADLRELPERTLVSAFGNAAGTQLWRLARGVDNRSVVPGAEVKSIGHEETFSVDLIHVEDLRRELLRQAEAVGRRLRKDGVMGRTVTLKLRYADFTTITRSKTLIDATDLASEILKSADEMLKLLDVTPGVRLLGVSISRLQDGSVRQLRLEELSDAGWRPAEEAVDKIQDRFGIGSIGLASILESDGLHSKRRGAQQWGPDEEPDREPPRL